MGEPWRATFLGGFTLARGEERRERLRSLKTEALLACLAAAPGRRFSRDELIARFWPDDPIESGRNNLRVALSRLRSALGVAMLHFAEDFWRAHVGPLTDGDIEEREMLLSKAALATEPPPLTLESARALLLAF